MSNVTAVEGFAIPDDGIERIGVIGKVWAAGFGAGWDWTVFVEPILPDGGVVAYNLTREQAEAKVESLLGWVHDPNRDGAGCAWCGTFSKVNDENLCRPCHEEG